MNVSVYTLGCKLNQCESEAIADAFSKQGFNLVDSGTPAELYIVNTCTVTSKAEQKARRMIRKYATEGQEPVVVVTGCYAQMEQSEIERLHERVVVVSLDNKSALLHFPTYLAQRMLAGFSVLDAAREFADGFKKTLDSHTVASPFDYDAATFSHHCRAFLKIQDGCDNACAYCRVTLARGDAVSLDRDEAIRRSLVLEQEGFTEIVLAGVNINAYRSHGEGLEGLLRELLAALGPDMRIRLSSMEPDRLDDKLIDLFADRRIQPHFHIPVQSGSDVVLKRVDRHYNVQSLVDLVARLRVVKDDPFIAADVITGLPSETDGEFEKTVRFLKEQDFSQLHVFPYSPRPKTALYDAKDRITESLRDKRAQVLGNLSAIQLRKYMDRQVGKHLEAVLEEHKDGVWWALTGNYLKIRVLDVPSGMKPGQRLEVILERDMKTPAFPVARYEKKGIGQTPE
ncbi:MAG: tRNA (N(6)-L-threonylcarbamoyladenosine(37)-C(2))-methylthiotransferase MtaB [Sphaerochaetaceae bacterium]